MTLFRLHVASKEWLDQNIKESTSYPIDIVTRQAFVAGYDFATKQIAEEQPCPLGATLRDDQYAKIADAVDEKFEDEGFKFNLDDEEVDRIADAVAAKFNILVDNTAKEYKFEAWQPDDAFFDNIATRVAEKLGPIRVTNVYNNTLEKLLDAVFKSAEPGGKLRDILKDYKYSTGPR